MTRDPRAAALVLCCVALAAPAAAQDTAAVKHARITYLTAATAYLDAGRLDGLRDTARVEVVRSGTAIGVLRVAFLASHKASCDIVTSTTPLAVGDVVRFVPAAAPRDAGPVAPQPARVATAGRRGAGSGLRGRIGAQYLAVGQSGGMVGGFSQPSFDLRLDGHPQGAPGLAVALDVRARRTYTILPDGSAVTDGRTRVYQSSVSLNAPGSPARVTIGRQISGNLATIGVFDGVMGEFNRPGWGTGAFAGTQPEPLDLGFSSAITQFGVYVQGHNRPGAASHWALTLGASGSYDGGQANREFTYVQASYLGARLSTLVTQEVDYYRSWKLLPGMETVSPTSTFALFQVRVTKGLTVDAGFDNRRNVRLYRDTVNPATAFDDTYRQGAWAGVSMRVRGHYGLGIDARSSSGGPAGRAEAYTVSVAVDRITALGLSFRSRSTRYTGPQLDGWLHSIALGLEPSGRVRVGLNGGVRQELNPLADPPTAVWATWVGADLDVNVARSWYVMLSATRETGGFESNEQLYGGASFRF